MKKEFKKIVKDVFEKKSLCDIGFERIKSDFDYDITFKKNGKERYYYILFSINSSRDAILVLFGWSKTEKVPVRRLIPNQGTYKQEESALFDIHFFDESYVSNSFEEYNIRPGKYFIAPDELEEYCLKTRDLCCSIKKFLFEHVENIIQKIEYRT